MNNADNKLLVLIDGRIVYTPLFSGVLWDAQDVLLQDVERIEVISGPGGTLWGSNAVNGVINIITRGASSTQGSLVAVGGGNQERDFAARYGGKLGDDGFFRLYAKGFHDDSTARSRRHAARRTHGRGRRSVSGPTGRSEIDRAGRRIQRRAGPGECGDSSTFPAPMSLRDGRTQCPAGIPCRRRPTIDQTQFEIPGAPGIGTLQERLNIYDVELQYNMKSIGAHTVTWGAGYRYARDHLEQFAGHRVPSRSSGISTWANLFIQDEIALHDDVDLTAGVRGEHNSYTGFEVLPSACA